MSKQLDKFLKPFRDGEDDRDAALVHGDAEAIRVIAAWSKTRVEWKRPKTKAPSSRYAVWAWLWSGCWYDQQNLISAARLSKRKALKALRACALGQLIYPDGTISEPAELAIDVAMNRRRQPKRKDTTT